MKIWAAATMLAAAVSAANASISTTTRVGALDYVEGKAYLNGSAIPGTKDNLPILDNGQTLSTGAGHAEMLLTPGVFLRLGDQSAIRLLNASLTDTRLRLDRGAAMIEVDNIHKDNRIQMEVGSGTARILKTGLYRFEADPASAEVLSGQLEAVGGDRVLKAGKHHEVLFASTEPSVTKFKSAPDDELSRWSRLRSEYEADASVSSAQYAYDMGFAWGGYPYWFWNPWFSTWTWFPASGYWLNPYGFGFWSPIAVYNYYPRPYYGRRAFAPRTGVATSAPPVLRTAPRSGFRSIGGRSFSMSGRSFGGGFAHGRR